MRGYANPRVELQDLRADRAAAPGRELPDAKGFLRDGSAYIPKP